MQMFDVYPLFEIEIVKAKGSFLFDDKGKKYLDFYGGHAVISIGHNHPKFVEAIQRQLSLIAFYSNSIRNPLQDQLVQKLSKVSGLDSYSLFLCNSGAEANENAIKLSSFYNDRTKILSLKHSFHGRMTSTASASDTLKYKSGMSKSIQTDFVSADHLQSFLQAIHSREYTCVMIEKIQGIGGLHIIPTHFLKAVKKACDDTDTILIMDEVQCGCGRSGAYFAFQHDQVQPDIISMAKGIGNGFPIGGILIDHQKIKPIHGLLGSTFGGNQLACAAALSVLDVIQSDSLIDSTQKSGRLLIKTLAQIPGVRKVSGMGLMLGVEFDFPVRQLRHDLIYHYATFTGASSNPNLLRILPPLNIGQMEIDWFINALTNAVLSFQNELAEI